MDISKHITDLYAACPDGFFLSEAKEIIGNDYSAILEILVTAGVVSLDGGKYIFTSAAFDIINYQVDTTLGD